MPATCENRLQVATRDLHALIRIHKRGYFEQNQDFGQSGWERINDPTDFIKIVVINRNLGLFVKTYAPATKDYAIRMHRALMQLSQLQDLPVPPLLPIKNPALRFATGGVFARA